MAAATPKYLLPDMEGTPVSEPAIYRSLFIVDTLAPQASSSSSTGESAAVNAAADNKSAVSSVNCEPIDPFDEKKIGSETQRALAVGILTVHKQGWTQIGLALGNLLQSVCLAPGEVTRVAVTDWRRKTSAKSVESTDQSEAVSSQIDQSRAVNEVQKAVASEAQSGGSSAFAGSASTQGGFAMTSLFASGSVSAAASTSTALTAQFSTGNRGLAASSTNAISQRTAEKSQALRSRRQSVVREVSEQESEQLSSRVLANYNRRHSLNVEYFEVLQIYQIKTELAGWERCLFVPFKPIDFSDAAALKAHKAQLFDIFRSLGAVDLANRLATAEKDQNAIEAMGKAIDEKIREVAEAFQALVRFKLLSDQKPVDKASHDAGIKLNADSYTATQKKYPDILTPIEVLAAVPITNWLTPLIQKLLLERAQLHLPLSDILNTHRIFLSQQIWVRMDPYRIYRALQKYTLDGKPLSSLVEPRPVGVFGNYLAFRWGFTAAQEKEENDFKEKYLQTSNEVGEKVGLPTSGVFAEAVLGRGEAAEEIDVTRFGRWQDNQPPILPPGIADLTSRDRAKGADFRGQDFAPSLAQLRAERLSDVSYIDRVLGQVSKGDMFRNMGGLAEAVSLAEKLSAISGEGATAAGNRAVELQKKMLDTFVEVLNSDVGKAAVAEFMLPGAGAALLGASNGGTNNPGKNPSKADAEADDSITTYVVDKN